MTENGRLTPPFLTVPNESDLQHGVDTPEEGTQLRRAYLLLSIHGPTLALTQTQLKLPPQHPEWTTLLIRCNWVKR
jgi:hypothetical protein